MLATCAGLEKSGRLCEVEGKQTERLMLQTKRVNLKSPLLSETDNNGSDAAHCSSSGIVRGQCKLDVKNNR
jgi:hypothetical protein